MPDICGVWPINSPLFTFQIGQSRLHEVMDALEEWLEPTIRCELSDGLKWLESSSVDSASNTSHFEDDGSTLRVKVSKSGTVQMIKV